MQLSAGINCINCPCSLLIHLDILELSSDAESIMCTKKQLSLIVESDTNKSKISTLRIAPKHKDSNHVHNAANSNEQSATP